MSQNPIAKDIHIVFQVLNWLHSDHQTQYQLLPNAKLLLINLASHKGIEGIFPSIDTLSKELNLAKRYVITLLNQLSKQKLIKIVKKKGCHNVYFLTIPFEKLTRTSDPQCTTTSDLSSKSYPQVVIPRSPVDSELVIPRSPPLVIPRSPDWCSTDHPNNKVITKINNKERALSVFEPSEEARALARELSVDVNIECDSFLRKGPLHKTQEAFMNWIRQSHRFHQKPNHDLGSVVKEIYAPVNRMEFHVSKKNIVNKVDIDSGGRTSERIAGLQDKWKTH